MPPRYSRILAVSGFSDEICLDRRLETQAAVCAALGMEWVALRTLDVGEGVQNALMLSEFQASRVRQVLADHGLGVSSLGSPLGKVRLRDIEDGTSSRYRPPGEYLDDEVRRACDVANRLECRLVRGFSFYPPADSDPWLHVDEAADRVAAIIERCDAAGLTYGLEVEANLVGHDADLLMEIHRRVDHPGLVLVFDGGNLVVQGFSAAEIFQQWRTMLPAIGWMHIKDCRHVADSGGDGSRHVDEEQAWPFVPAGQGDAGYAEILADLVRHLPAIMARMSRRGVDHFFLDLEPHVLKGGQFGGYSGPRGFGDSLRALAELVDRAQTEAGRPGGPGDADP